MGHRFSIKIIGQNRKKIEEKDERSWPIVAGDMLVLLLLL